MFKRISVHEEYHGAFALKVEGLTRDQARYFGGLIGDALFGVEPDETQPTTEPTEAN